MNSGYIIFEQISGAEYTVLCDDVELDEQLIRYYDTYEYNVPTETDGQTTWTKTTLTKVVRADALGLAAGTHTMKVAVKNSTNYSKAEMKVLNHDRSGFGFTDTTVPGAYNKDGTLKSNAIVLYVDGNSAKTVSYTAVKGTNSSRAATYTGLQDILSEQSLKNLTVPLDIRIIGTITLSQMDSIGSSAEGLQIKTTSNNGVTIEGVGHDAAVYGFGFLIRNAHYVEVANLGVFNFLDDGISVDTDNSYLWIHHNDISYGAVGSDSDQAKGDGSLDFKKSTYSTLSYNHFWDSGKCNLLDASAASSGGSNYLTYHHNWYDHSDSRHPRIRNATAVHVYNNYYDGNSKYGVGVTTGSSALVEGNYFRDANAPMMSSMQGTDAQGTGTFSDEAGGVIKAWNNYIGDNSYNKLHFVTNKYDYTNNQALGTAVTKTETIGTQNSDGSWTIYDAKVTSADGTVTDEIASCSFISAVNAAFKTDKYQVSAGKTGFNIKVPANVTKVVVKAKCGTSNQTGTANMLKVNGTSVSMDMAANYTDYEVLVSVSSDSTIEIANAHSSNSMNVREIKVIASSGWSTTYTTGASVSLDDIDAYEVDSRNDTVPSTVTTKKGGNTYSNFDTQLGLSGLGLSTVPSGPKTAKADVIALAGRHNPDFAWTFDNATEDKNYGIISALKNTIVGYTTSYVHWQGTTAGGSTTGGGNSGDTGNTGNTGNSSGSGDTGNTSNTGTTDPVTSDPVSVTGVGLNKTETTLTVGGTETLKATVSPSNATDSSVSWTSSDSSVATVSKGKITAKAVGTAIITATTTDGSFTATCSVTVEAAPAVDLSSLSAVSAGEYDLTTGGKVFTKQDNGQSQTHNNILITSKIDSNGANIYLKTAYDGAIFFVLNSDMTVSFTYGTDKGIEIFKITNGVESTTAESGLTLSAGTYAVRGKTKSATKITKITFE
mgnify:CR=1 FL=1